jgi:MFS family permease
MEVLPEISVLSRPLLSVASHGEQTAPPLRRMLGTVSLAWMFGSVYAMTTTSQAITVFADKLGASNFQFGLLTAIPFLAALLSVPGAVLSECLGRCKPVFLNSFYVQRGLWFLIALVPIWILTHPNFLSPGCALTCFLWLLFAAHASGSVGVPSYISWMGDVVPSRIKGNYFARRRQLGNLTALPAAVFVGWLLDRQAGNSNLAVLITCAILFGCSAICGLTDIHLFQFVPPTPRPTKRLGDVIGAFRQPLRDKAFLRFSFVIGWLTFAINLFGQFATLYLIERAGASNLSAQLILVAAPMGAQLVVFRAWGKAADRIGKRPLIIVAAIGLIPVSIGWCFVGASTLWLAYILSALTAALWAAIEVVNLNLVLEASSDSRAAGGCYAAVNTVIVNVAGCLGGLGAGFVAQALEHWTWRPIASMRSLNYFDVLFGLSGVLRAVAFALVLLMVVEPRAKTIGQLFSSTINWIKQAGLMLPLKLHQARGNSELEGTV